MMIAQLAVNVVLGLSFAKQGPAVFQRDFNHLPITDHYATVSVHPAPFE